MLLRSGALEIIGGIVTLAGISPTDDKPMLVLIGLLAIASGLCFAPTCTSSKRRFSPGLVCVFMAFPILLFCAWLIYSYKTYSTLPEIWVYAIEVIGVCVCIFAFFFNAGYPADRAKPRRSMFFSMLGTFFCFMMLADSRSAGLQIILLVSGLMLLAENWMIMSNSLSSEDREKLAKKNAAAEKAPAPEDSAPDGNESVLSPGGETENAPTLEFFDNDTKQ